uniref:Steroid-5-alpha-reductase, alpha polypeptide 2a n=1 Tax=Sander lucioperca TaxID=283035 RepID=A0A8D0D3X6_SANLU
MRVNSSKNNQRERSPQEHRSVCILETEKHLLSLSLSPPLSLSLSLPLSLCLSLSLLPSSAPPPGSSVYEQREMECREAVVSSLSWALIAGGALYLLQQTRSHTPYGRYAPPGESRCCPARLGWFLQEVPAFLLPLLILHVWEEKNEHEKMISVFRTFIYSFLMRGRPVPLPIVLYAAIFCSLNGFLQGHFLLHCARYDPGFLLFVCGLIINIHSDHILRSLRRPGETVYRIPYGGMFEFVSGANFFGEIVEWCGYAVATWSLPTFAFAFFTVCSIGPRAVHHHRYGTFFTTWMTRGLLLPFIAFSDDA